MTPSRRRTVTVAIPTVLLLALAVPGLAQQPGSPEDVLPDRTRAIRWALADARPGDSVLIAGRDSLLPLNQEGATGDAEVAQQYLYDDEPRILPFPSPA